jgi:hypothetical protein
LGYLIFPNLKRAQKTKTKMAGMSIEDIQDLLQDTSSMVTDSAPEDATTPEPDVGPPVEAVDDDDDRPVYGPVALEPENMEPQNMEPQNIVADNIEHDPDLIVTIFRNCLGTGAKDEDVKVANIVVNGSERKYVHDFFPQDVVENSKKKFFVLKDKMGQEQSIHEFHRLHGYVNQKLGVLCPCGMLKREGGSYQESNLVLAEVWKPRSSSSKKPIAGIFVNIKSQKVERAINLQVELNKQQLVCGLNMEFDEEVVER